MLRPILDLRHAPVLRRAFSRIPPLQETLTFPPASSSKPPPVRNRERNEGDISSVFASLSNAKSTPLSPRFAAIKTQLISSPNSITSSFHRLIKKLQFEVATVSKLGSSIIPSIDFQHIHNHSFIQPFSRALQHRGVAIIRNVVPSDLALSWKAEIQDYIGRNPHTKAFPKDNPAVYELYWSPGQVKARAHPNMLETQRYLLSFWHSKDPSALICNEPVTYADRVRIRQPGDAGFALGPHVDGGGVERWEPDGYGRGDVYTDIFAGSWESFDAWESSGRLKVESDLYECAGGCTAFRMFQGWLAMSNTGPAEGTLLVNPLFKAATAYYLLRPFFSPVNPDPKSSVYLEPENWQLDDPQTSALQGATPGLGQELSDILHPHLELAKTMVHVPKVGPGDYVVWHCDTIHAVDKVHQGSTDSSVLYIPVCPLTETNSRYLVRQREQFLSGRPGPDFPGGEGESKNVGRMGWEDVKKAGGVEAEMAMGLRAWKSQGECVRVCNDILEAGK